MSRSYATRNQALRSPYISSNSRRVPCARLTAEAQTATAVARLTETRQAQAPLGVRPNRRCFLRWGSVWPPTAPAGPAEPARQRQRVFWVEDDGGAHGRSDPRCVAGNANPEHPRRRYRALRLGVVSGQLAVVCGSWTVREDVRAVLGGPGAPVVLWGLNAGEPQPCGWGSRPCNDVPAVTYSPTPSRVQYHRRCGS